MSTYLRATLAAAIASSAAVVGTLAASSVLRRTRTAISHQQPTADLWREPATPTSAAMVRQGRHLFLNNCAHCHGIDARGDEGPDLHDEQVSDRYIARVIGRGIPHEMPAFAKKLTADDVASLTAYIRTLESE